MRYFECIGTLLRDCVWERHSHVSFISFPSEVTNIATEKMNAGCILYGHISDSQTFTEALISDNRVEAIVFFGAAHRLVL